MHLRTMKQRVAWLVQGITHLGPGAAGPDLLGPCAGAMAEAAQTVLTAPDAASLMQYGPVRGDGRSVNSACTIQHAPGCLRPTHR
eukprot:SAG11_NODE_50_length_19992_cov_9.945157_16_plen_85_part_00